MSDSRLLRHWVLLALLLGGACFAQAPRNDGTRRTNTLAPGIEHWELKRGDFNTEGKDRWTINVLSVDAKRARLRLGLATDEIVGAETTSQIARRRGALAAINGGYFRTSGPARGEPIGVLAIDDKVLSEPAKRRAALAVQFDGQQIRTTISHIGLQATLQVGAAQRPVSGINRPRAGGELIVFTPEFHRSSLTSAEGLEAIVTNNRITEVVDNAGDQIIPRNGLVISASGRARVWAQRHLRRGATVAFKTQIEARPPLPFKPAYILGGGPQLVGNGKSTTASETAGYATDFYQQRHPRTAIGWRKDGTLILVTVDGRQPQRSVGMTIEELAGLMLELGCVEALNMDGGGSTTMVVKDRVVNSPSDLLGERAVSDALLVFPR
jgi:exopolysaccharide biosynthesis protein